MSDRFVIAFDKKGVYLRKTIAVMNRYEIGEVHYQTEPLPNTVFTEELVTLLERARRIIQERMAAIEDEDNRRDDDDFWGNEYRGGGI